jgi:hypothetical protein
LARKRVLATLQTARDVRVDAFDGQTGKAKPIVKARKRKAAVDVDGFVWLTPDGTLIGFDDTFTKTGPKLTRTK